jgi:hypothetical protein
MTVKSSIQLTDEQHRFAKELVEAGRYWHSCLFQLSLVSLVCDVDIEDVRCGYWLSLSVAELPFPKAGRQAKQLL